MYNPCDECTRECDGCRVIDLVQDVQSLKSQLSKRTKQLEAAVGVAFDLRGQLIKLTAKKEY